MNISSKQVGYTYALFPHWLSNLEKESRNCMGNHNDLALVYKRQSMVIATTVKCWAQHVSHKLWQRVTVPQLQLLGSRQLHQHGCWWLWVFFTRQCENVPLISMFEYVTTSVYQYCKVKSSLTTARQWIQSIGTQLYLSTKFDVWSLKRFIWISNVIERLFQGRKMIFYVISTFAHNNVYFTAQCNHRTECEEFSKVNSISFNFWNGPKCRGV